MAILGLDQSDQWPKEKCGVIARVSLVHPCDSGKYQGKGKQRLDSLALMRLGTSDLRYLQFSQRTPPNPNSHRRGHSGTR